MTDQDDYLEAVLDAHSQYRHQFLYHQDCPACQEGGEA